MLKTWVSRLTTAVVVVVCLFVLFVAYGLLNNRWYHVLAVEGGSMEPSIHWGDGLVITRPPDELKPGMVVTMEIEGQLVTHRVVSVDPLVTKGDANSAPDQWEPGQVRIVGQVRLRVPRLGWVLHRLHLAAVSLTGAFFHARDTVPAGLHAAVSFGEDKSPPRVSAGPPRVSAGPPRVSAGPPRRLEEGSTFNDAGFFNDSGDNAWTAVIDYGDGSGSQELTLGSERTFTLSHAYAESGFYTATVSVTDEAGLTGSGETRVTVRNAPPRVGDISWRTHRAARESTVKASCAFTDPGVLDAHTAIWNWGDARSAGTVTETDGSGTVEGSHVYAQSGIYTVRLTVTDDDGATTTVVGREQVIVSGGDWWSVAGAGSIDSPAGACAPQRGPAGVALFCFWSQDNGSGAAPTGEFDFRLGSLHFVATDLSGLWLHGSKAVLKGSGRIDGSGRYGFILSMIDVSGPADGGGDVLRLLIWRKASGKLVYDNQPGSSPQADPIAPIKDGDLSVCR